MSDHRSGTASGGNGLITAGVIIAALVGAGVYLSLQNDELLSDEEASALVSPVETTALEQAPGLSPVVEDAPETSPALETERVEEESASEQVSSEDVTEVGEQSDKELSGTAPASVAPTIDEVRVDQNGVLVVAGRAAPGSRVDVLVDGEIVTSADADTGGAFAALGSISAKDAARTLTLRSGEGSEALVSNEEIILAPLKPPASPPVQSASTASQEAPQEAPSDGPGASSDVAVAALGKQQVAETNEALVASGLESTDSNPEAGASDGESLTEVAEGDVSQDRPETSEIAVLRSDPSGVSLVQKAPAAGVELDTIAYSEDGDVQLGGRADLKTVEIRAYLNNRAVARLPVSPDGNWRGEVPDVDAGIYTLRVDALTADGSVSSRIETPFKREEPAALAAAIDDAGGPLRAVTVQAGDTLWAIARERYGEGVLYVQVFEANRDAIRDPDLIYPGQVFDLPGD